MITDLLPEKGLILCAVSGGADSMYMLCLLHELGHRVAAAHFHHGLRGTAADRDEAFVRDFCRERGIPFLSGHGDTAGHAAEHHLSIEDAARDLRYEFLENSADTAGAEVIATAHTADDNAETILMHLTRGSGLSGLSGIPPRRGRVIRPILDETHEQALAYLSAHGLPHIEDETNASDQHFRNRIRHHVVPLLQKENPGFALTLTRTASLLRKDEAFLAGLAQDFINEHCRGNALPADALTALPSPVAQRVIRKMAGSSLSAVHTQAVLRTAEHGGFADIPGMRAGRSGSLLVFGVPQQTDYWEHPISPGTVVTLPEAGCSVRCEYIPVLPGDVYKSFNTFFFPCANIYGNITVTARRPGDRFRPARRGCSKTVRRLLMEAGIPSWARGSVPVLRDERGILGVRGLGQDERVFPAPGTHDLFRIDFIGEVPDNA